ncbi:hypothetical protein [Luteimonas sp. MC1572]|uniref:hypothetical protein n=1 Tax=Luteimonas sp. MC1572 TaxID=2799325 RepID=UPI0018F0C8DB|nr:hypothetical protein [Luteimonas sp. MC1572]MBJ6983015.1 hypothetical protein [Luteimonas sp. MC1572]QQO03242.1 hypothetical protein JGR64_00200 [Luteimonas sp. MC1572]
MQAVQDKEQEKSLAIQLLEEGKSVAEVVNALQNQGLDEIVAFGIVSDAINRPRPEAVWDPREDAIESLKIGAAVLLGAIAVTVATYAIAGARGGGRYFVAVGAFIFAGYYLLKGLWRLARS